MSQSEKVTPIRPLQIMYKGHKIELAHRRKTNDWSYTVSLNRPITRSHHAPRYDTAVKEAKSFIDAATKND